jgi:HPt (histidine-containing phosphotransfer) domain-containing protein
LALLKSQDAIDQVKILRDYHVAERARLDIIRRYWKGRQRLPEIIPSSAPREVRIMARIARVNVCPIVIDTLAQSTFVDGFRGVKTDDNAGVWQVWQANKMDAHQTAIHRAAFAYGAAYGIVLPGKPVPVIRAASPRSMTVMYGEDPDWPMWALQRLGGGLWKLFDEQAVYYVAEEQTKTTSRGVAETTTTWRFVETLEHGMGVVPVVRFLDEDDLDADDEATSEIQNDVYWDVPARGQIAPLMSIQDQIDLTTFGLLVAQWYSAFRQRYVIGWVPDDEAQKMKAGASQLWTFEDEGDGGDGVKVGEFGQTDLDGYIKSREASLKHAATLSQTPVHELLGELVNLSAEALAAAEAGHERKVDERKTLLGESHEQMLRLVGQLTKDPIPEDAEVIWRDTGARTFAATVDGLGKLVAMLGIPAHELWERVPGATQQDVERWKAAAAEGDSFDRLAAILARQTRSAA